MPFLADCSLSLINRTGAHYAASDIVEGLPQHFPLRRYWRLIRPACPEGTVRKVLGRMMLREIRSLGTWPGLPWPEPSGKRLRRAFMDPLYVTRSGLDDADLVLCHDIGPVSHPQLFDPVTVEMYRLAYAKIRDRRPAMVFVSEASKAAFSDFYGSDYPSMTAIPLHVRTESAQGNAEPLVEAVHAPFLLTVGAFERRKNLPRAIEAFRRSGLAAEGYTYVLCGARGLDADAVRTAADATPGVRLLSYVSDANLRWLYQNACAFVLPSLLEGFGMPALEAGAHGLVPVISAGGALEEAVAGYGVSVNPLSSDDIARGMREALSVPAQTTESLRLHAQAQTKSRFLGAWDTLLSGISRLKD